MSEDKKIGSGELLIFSFLFLFVDLACALLDLTVVGAGATPVIQGFFLFAMDNFLMGRGSKSVTKLGRKIAKYALQLIPFLPTLMTTFLIEAFVHNNPKVAQVVATKVTSMASKPSGTVAKIATKSVVS